MLEAAVAVARDGERSTPPVLAPGPLRRYLSFARLPDPALEVARRVLDDDPEFRARVAGAVNKEHVGRAGWAYLTRPDGWEAEVDELRQEAAAREAQARDERAERDAQRRLAGAEAAAARAISAAASAAAEADRLRAQLDQERAASAAAQAEVERLRADLVRATDQRAAAIQRVKDLEAAASARGAELKAVRHELRMAQAELAGTTDAAPAEDIPDPAAPPSPAVDHAAVARAVVDALAASDAARAALADAAALLGDADGTTEDEPSPSEATTATGSTTENTSPGARQRGGGRRRRPAALPPGVLDDGVEAAEHLVRVPGALLLIDGYNISNAQWHGLALPEQRARLLDACAELHARCGIDVEVVFDGAGEAGVGTPPRSGIRHRFTSAGDEADDVILARVDEEPVQRPVLVASSDRRVRDGARARGASVLGARQMLAVLRR